MIDCGCTTTSIAVVRRAEQVVGLDHLEALVHQRRRVDRDLAAHRPRRVLERLLDRHGVQLRARAAAERAAGGGEHEPSIVPTRRLAGDQLVQRGVLGVDRDDLRAGRLGERHDQLAADDERLLVGEREVDPLGQRHDRRAEPGRADDRVQHEVGVRARDELDQALGPARAPRRRSTPRPRARPRRGPTARSGARRARAPARSAARARCRRTGRRSRTRRPRARRRRAPACRSSRSIRGSGAASSATHCGNALLRPG